MTTTQNLELLLKALHAGEDVPLEILKDAYEEAGEPLPWTWIKPRKKSGSTVVSDQENLRITHYGFEAACVAPSIFRTGRWFYWVGTVGSGYKDTKQEAVRACEERVMQMVRQGKTTLCSPTT